MVNPADVLAGLDDVAWGKLNHAYGPAEDVPGDLRAICGSDAEARKKAVGDLFASIFDQGTRYAALPFAVPFLARIAVAGPSDARVDALRLLTRLAVDWHDEYDLPFGIAAAAWRAAAPSPAETLREFDERIAEETNEKELKWLRDLRDYAIAGNPIDDREGALRSYDAVRRELPLLQPLLGDRDGAVRRRVAYLVSWFPEASTVSVPALAARLGLEEEPEVLATVVVGIGL
jgi:hypothetical protein